MIHGILKQWRTGCYMLYDDKKMLNHYLDQDSVVEVQVKGKWKKVEWHTGPGGIFGTYDDGDRGVPELLPARMYEVSDKVVQIRR